MATQLFTLEEATALLPWLRERLVALAPLYRQLVVLQGEMEGLVRSARTNGGSSLEDELARQQRTAQRLARQVEEGVQTITRRGIVVRDIVSGLVDFPSMREGREVYLCWTLAEERIEFWHPTNTGYADRRPL